MGYNDRKTYKFWGSVYFLVKTTLQSATKKKRRKAPQKTALDAPIKRHQKDEGMPSKNH